MSSRLWAVLSISHAMETFLQVGKRLDLHMGHTENFRTCYNYLDSKTYYYADPLQSNQFRISGVFLRRRGRFFREKPGLRITETFLLC